MVMDYRPHDLALYWPWEKAVLLFAVRLVGLLLSTAEKVFYVKPTIPTTECPGPGDFTCHSLQYYANHSSFTNNSRFFFLEGEHHWGGGGGGGGRGGVGGGGGGRGGVGGGGGGGGMMQSSNSWPITWHQSRDEDANRSEHLQESYS